MIQKIKKIWGREENWAVGVLAILLIAFLCTFTGLLIIVWKASPVGLLIFVGVVVLTPVLGRILGRFVW